MSTRNNIDPSAMSASTQYTSIHLYRKMMDCALAEGLSVDFFDQFTVPYHALDEVKAVPSDEFYRLHERIDKVLTPGFSIRVGQQMKIEDYGVLGLSWRTCSKAVEIFERNERYFKLLSNTYVFKVEQKAKTCYVHLLRDAYRRGVELSNEATFSATVVVLQLMTEKPINPTEVAFKHAAPGNIKSYEEAFGCPILFNQKQNYIAYDTADILSPTAKADQSINAFLVQRVEEETKGIEVSPNSIVTDVRRLIKDALPSGIPSIGEVSRHLGMSSRTLTRRLVEGNITFRQLIQNTQEEIAKQLLQRTDHSIGEIAFLTGFSEQSAFNRAFKKWTTQTPSDFRKGR
ncbi:MAG: AraC family transcriptional regulator ligand-binding domain-containing protein [Bacteroidota bacterium]